MIDVGHALHGREPVGRDELVPAVVLDIGSIVQQPFHAVGLLLADMLRVRSRVVGGFADAVSGPDDVCSGRHGRTIGLVGAEVGDRTLEMGEQPIRGAVRVGPLRAEKADRVEEMMEPRGKRIQTKGTWRVKKNQSINSFTVSLHLHSSFVRDNSTGRPASEYIWAVRLSPTYLGEEEGRDGWYPYGIIFRALKKRTVQAVYDDVITDSRNLSIGPSHER